MPLACFAANSNVSVHWKHTEGISLRHEAILLSLIVADINHHICQCKKNSVIFIFAFSDNLISEDWFFAEGERFLSFWRCHRPRWGGRRWWCGMADSSFGLKSDMPQR